MCLDVGKDERTADRNPDGIEASIGNSLEVGEGDPVIPMLLQDIWSRIWMIFTQGPLINGGMAWERLED